MENKKFFKAGVIEASAGTGKTRYIIEEIFRIYERYKDPEILKRILAITFSEKAAIEMKERFLSKIYSEVYNSLSDREKVNLENILLKLQISTIHSYFQTLLRRFYFLTGIDPYFEIIEKGESGVLFNSAIYKVLNTKEGRNDFAEISKKFKLNYFKKILFSFLNSHPYIFLGEPEGEITEKFTSFYENIDRFHSLLKKEFSYLDFDDLEKLTYRTLKRNPDALIVLEDFDENVNFIFIDEFQDTNLLQWEIVKTLIEEWLSGYGAKAEEGKEFGLVIVGDRKQSIYKFRGAESKLFDDVKEVLSEYLMEKVLVENYRSSRNIIDFVNKIFEDEIPWKEQKLVVSKNGSALPSKIEINFFEDEEEEESKKREYEWLCKKIIGMVKDKMPVFENNEERALQFRDIAILMRKRKGKYFKLFENILSSYGIPYVVIGGVGFYQEEEVIMLLSLFFALVDPTDEFSVWNVKNSVLKIDEEELEKWRKCLEKNNVVEVFEQILVEKNIWEKLNEQQRANCEKFLLTLHNQRKQPLFQISQNLREIAEKFEEPKANVFSIQQDAVRIYTIHGAKGLGFPCVFLINIEDAEARNTGDIIYLKEKGGYRYVLKGLGENDLKEKFNYESIEEEKRLLYVALTRASQYLFISGLKKKRKSLLWLRMLEGFEEEYPAEEIKEKLEIKQKRKEKKEEVKIPSEFTSLTSYSLEKEWAGKSEEAVFGDILHRILRDISEGKIDLLKNIFVERGKFYLKKKFEKWEAYIEKLESIFDKIENSEIKNIIKTENGYSEVPFVYTHKGKVIEGRIDRIIIEENTGKIYDYKLSVKNPALYKTQLQIYENAVKKIFNVGKIEKFLISLSEGKIYKVD